MTLATQDIVPVSEQGLRLPDNTELRQAIQQINQFQQLVHSQLIDGHDYGVIQATGRSRHFSSPAQRR